MNGKGYGKKGRLIPQREPLPSVDNPDPRPEYELKDKLKGSTNEKIKQEGKMNTILERIGGCFFAIFLVNLILWLCGWAPGDRAFEIGTVTLIGTIACPVIISIIGKGKRRP
ncbi:MAG: hypothetical protein F4Y79_03160 [Gemmatimonadetes bacterium]|nr:hypothetical protein [Gemmatimonadota bacterium]